MARVSLVSWFWLEIFELSYSWLEEAISSAESQKDSIADQWYSVENQKGAIAIDSVQQ